MSERAPRRLAIWWLALPAGVALLMSGVVVGRSSARSTTTIIKQEADRASSSGSSDRRLEALEQEVARLRADRLALSRQDAPAKPDEQVAKGEPAPSKPTSEDNERALDEARAQFLDGLGDRLATEPLDPRWRAETERAISTLLPQRMGPGITVADVACGSSICRAKVQHAQSPHLPEARLADFMLQRGPLANMQVNLDTRETGATTLYFIREEQPTP
jgi:hypothetical protein